MCEAKIMELLEIASNLILEAHTKDPESDVFDQAGILTGKEIVLGYLEHGEFGMAVEHLLYMVHESEIFYPKPKLITLNETAKKLNVANNYVPSNT